MERLTVDHLVRLYLPVGEIVVQWAITDTTINHLALFVFGILGREEAALSWPVQFSARLELLEQHLKKHPTFKAISASLKPVFKDIRHLQKLRDMLIHGVAVQYDSTKDAVLFQRIDRTTKKQRKRKPTISHQRNSMLVRFSALEGAANGIFEVNKRLSAERQTMRSMLRAMKKGD